MAPLATGLWTNFSITARESFEKRESVLAFSSSREPFASAQCPSGFGVEDFRGGGSRIPLPSLATGYILESAHGIINAFVLEIVLAFFYRSGRFGSRGARDLVEKGVLTGHRYTWTKNNSAPLNSQAALQASSSKALPVAAAAVRLLSVSIYIRGQAAELESIDRPDQQPCFCGCGLAPRRVSLPLHAAALYGRIFSSSSSSPWVDFMRRVQRGRTKLLIIFRYLREPAYNEAFFFEPNGSI